MLRTPATPPRLHASLGRVGKRARKAAKPRNPVDESTVWLVDIDLERNGPLREKIVELALALGRRIADQDHEASLARHASAGDVHGSKASKPRGTGKRPRPDPMR